MRKVIKYMATALLTISLSACSDFLDKEYDTSMSEDQVLKNKDNTRGFLATIYTTYPMASVVTPMVSS